MRAFVRAFGDHRWKRIVGVTAAQSGKTASLLDIIGERLDNRPAPILYVGPTKDFLADQLEPRITEIFRQAPTLGAKVIGGVDGKLQKKTLKRVAGVRLRLAHAGSSSALKSDAAAVAFVDEYDEMIRNIRGQGDPLGLVEARGDTYADFQCGITSTPSLGMAEIVHDSDSGLDFWRIGMDEEIQSPIWRLWQEGTRHHFAWPCPHCGEFFIPRSKLLRYPANATPMQALHDSYLECPHCKGEVREEHKWDCNQRGVFIAPGEKITKDGEILGSPADTSTLSFWISGFCSPFKTIGERAERYLRALASGESDKIQTAVNAGFGELYIAGGGELPEWQEVVKMREKYERKIPDGVLFLVMAVDVQGNRLPYVIRGFGAQGTSWLIEHGYIWGPTKDEDVWEKLSEKLNTKIDGRSIKLAFIDSGFRPGKKEGIPFHRVYEFCRKHKKIAFPTKGSSSPMVRPLIESVLEVNGSDGKPLKYGNIRLLRLDTDHWKAVVHERLSFERNAPGALHFGETADEDYCQQLVAEARVMGPNNRWIWVMRSRENHFLDCEGMAAAAAWLIGSDRVKAAAKQNVREKEEAQIKSRLEGPTAAPINQGMATPAALTPPPLQTRSRFSNFASRLNR